MPMFYRLNFNRTESIVFNSIRLFYIEADRLAIWKVDIITFIDVGNVDVFRYAKDLNDR